MTSQPSILNSIDSKFYTEFLSVSNRYYQHKYFTKFTTSETNLDQRVSFHTNRICMISLAENHIIVKNNIKVNKINCIVDKTNRLVNPASGKGKRGAQKLNADSILCYLECSDGNTYPVYSCVTGKLLEINDNLVTNPHLLIEKPTSEGYIALVLPLLSLYNELKDSMICKNDYVV